MIRTVPLLFLLVPLLAQTRTDDPYEAKGPYAVESRLFDWRDAERDRLVPAKVYVPGGCEGPLPVIVVSHGLGGTRETYAYLGEHWASHGYLVVHVQHEGSDDGAWRGQRRPLEALRKAVSDPTNAIARPLDVSFALDRLTELTQARDDPLFGLADLDRVAIAGHSFGAYTALAACGRAPARLPGQKDPRIDACLAMSAPGLDLALEKRLYTKYATPTFHMTGTKDESVIGDTKVENRRTPFDSITGVDQYLITFTGGDHMVFSGRGKLDFDLGLPGWNGDRSLDEAFHQVIKAASTAFFDAHLKGSAEATAWLANSLEARLGELGVLETKRP